MSLVVTLTDPHLVLFCDREVQDILMYRSDEMMGRSAMLLCGPKSDPILLSSCIHHSHLRTTACQLVLYSSTGQPRTVMARFSPHHDGAGLPACRISVTSSEALALADVLAAAAGGESLPAVLVSADEPHDILLVTAPFAAAIGRQPAQLSGQPLRAIWPAPSSISGKPF